MARRKILFITAEAIVDMLKNGLKLPADSVVSGMQAACARGGIDIVLESSEYPDVAEGGEYPRICVQPILRKEVE